MTQVKSKKIKYASKVEEQIVDAIKSGKSLSGKDGILTPIIGVGRKKVRKVPLCS